MTKLALTDIVDLKAKYDTTLSVHASPGTTLRAFYETVQEYIAGVQLVRLRLLTDFGHNLDDRVDEAEFLSQGLGCTEDALQDLALSPGHGMSELLQIFGSGI